MANVLPRENRLRLLRRWPKVRVFRAIERMTGINRNPIMNLGVRVGQGCAKILDAKMRGLTCHFLQFDEVWGFIGKKEKHCMPTDDPTLGDVWTFCAIDSETKLVSLFQVW